MIAYEFEELKVKKFLKNHSAKLAAIQLPAGLRPHLPEIEAVFEGAGVGALVLGDSCYGACDVADAKAKQLGCDVLVHYGHADMGIRACLPTLYVEARMLVNPLEVIEKALPRLGFKRLGLLTTVQHIAHLQSIAKFLRSHGIKPFIGGPGPRARYPGQLLGCDFGCARSVSARVDGFLYTGTGMFHPLGAALVTGKRVLSMSPFSGELKALAQEVNGLLKKRRSIISRAATSGRFGVVVSTKPGQARFRLASEIVKDLRHAERDARLLVVDEVKPEVLMDFKLDAFICAACPRIAIDDAELFEQPILTPFEARVMLGKAKFEPYGIDEPKREDF